METHDFKECLAQSHAAADLPIWKEIYDKAFPGGIMVDHRKDSPQQRAGIDRSITMPNSKQFLIDEKIRGRNKKTGRVYEDIALEFWSNYEKRVPGWVCKPLLADYIAYAIGPLGKCYLLPVLQLQQTWAKHGEDWLKRMKLIEARNEGYTTHSVGVPVAELFQKMGQAFRIDFAPLEVEENGIDRKPPPKPEWEFKKKLEDMQPAERALALEILITQPAFIQSRLRQ